MSVYKNDIYTSDALNNPDQCIQTVIRTATSADLQPYASCAYANNVKEWAVLQGWRGPRAPYRKSLDVRYLRVENSGRDRIGVAINLYSYDAPMCKAKGPSFILNPGQTTELGINTIGAPMQAIWLFNLSDNSLVNTPHLVKEHVNQIVLRQGMNLWFCQDYKYGA